MQNNVIYQATVETSDGITNTYLGLASNFKERFRNHKDSFKNNATEKKKKSTTLSSHYWKSKNANNKPVISWKIVERAYPYNPVTNTYLLCIREKCNIIYEPHLGTLNRRNKIFSTCRHKLKRLLVEPVESESSEDNETN